MEDIDKIPFYKERTIGERMTAALDFLRDNWGVMFRMAIYMLLPLSIVQAVSMNSFFGAYMGLLFLGMEGTGMDGELAMIMRFLGSYGIMMLCFLLGSILLQAFSFTMVQVYNERENGLEGVMFSSIWPKMWHNIKRVLKSTLVMVGLIIVGGVLSFVNPIAFILFIPAIIVMSIPMLLFPCIYSLERGQDCSLSTWWSVL